MRDYVLLAVNGRRYPVRGDLAFLSLAEFLRTELALTGTKVVCAEGDCGACTVLVGRLRYETVDACIQLLYQLDGKHVLTVEGLAEHGELHPVQQALVEHHGSQCGYCTPGFVMALAGMFEEGTPATEKALRVGLTGNLCRCTGYLPILEAGRAVAAVTPLAERTQSTELAEDLREHAETPVLIRAGQRTFFSPCRLEDALAFKAERPDAVIVSGATELGVLRNKQGLEPTALLSLAKVPDLDGIRRVGDLASIGANVTWSQLEAFARTAVPEFHRLIVRFGSPQIRHVATLAGNVAHGSPIADALPFLMVMEAELELASRSGGRRVPVSGFYRGYKVKDLAADEIITRVLLPLPGPDDLLKLYKVSRRHDLDIATFGAAIRVQRMDGRIERAWVAYSGVAPTVMRLPRTEAFLHGQPFEEETFAEAASLARAEVRPISDVRGSRDFRLRLAENMLRKFYEDCTALVEAEESMALIGKPLPHDSAREHVTGEAVYLDDLPPVRGELLVDFVGSGLAHAHIRSVDVSGVDAAVAVLTHRDVPGDNNFGPIFHDEELLAKDVCRYIGQPIVALAAGSRAALQAAKAAVRLELEELPATLTIEEAIARRQLIGPTRHIRRGDVTTAFAQSEHYLEGTFQSGGQEHFYLETQAALAVPGEGGQITIHSSTQNPTEIQDVVAHCLGLRQNQVVCVCRRMGGGFGGKETQAALPALLAALAAFRTHRPARLVLSCDQDMRITGKRHPYLAHYRVGFAADGRITALKVEFFSNGGFSADLSLAVMERTLLHGDNAYYIPNVEFSGTVCRTNLPSNTAFRGFGGPQAVAAMENVIEEIAAHLGIDALEVRHRNCYGIDDRNVTPYGQIVRNNTLSAILDQLTETSCYRQRRAAVQRFNATARSRLKGIALTPVKFGISFTRRTLNQASALVNIYLDGTIQLSTGGTEMGQGLNTKLRQLVADQFALPAEAVLVMPTSTEKNNNTSPTAASASTDLNGSAAVRACEMLRGRLAEVAARHFASVEDGLEASPSHVRFEHGTVYDHRRPAMRLRFDELVRLAYEQRVNLGERGFYATPGVDFNRETGKGNPFLYYTNGAAVAEVLIDCHTGDVKVERVDLLIDVGQSINPAIDRGQVLGGFVQGMGWVTTEELRYGDAGQLLSHSPTTYKVPNVTDVPAIFNVAFFDNPDNDVNLYASKAVGEPPLMLGIAVWAAVKQALGGAALDLPATNEEVLRRLTTLDGGPQHRPGRRTSATQGAIV